MKTVKPQVPSAYIDAARRMSKDNGHSVEVCLGALVSAGGKYDHASKSLDMYKPVGCLYDPDWYTDTYDEESAYPPSQLDEFYSHNGVPLDTVFELFGSLSTGKKYYLAAQVDGLFDDGTPRFVTYKIFYEDEEREANECYRKSMERLQHK